MVLRRAILWSTLSESPGSTGGEDATRTLKCAGAIGRISTIGIDEKRTADLDEVMIGKRVATRTGRAPTGHMEVGPRGIHVGVRTAFPMPRLHPRLGLGRMSGGTLEEVQNAERSSQSV